jgi:hypothetical protein
MEHKRKRDDELIRKIVLKVEELGNSPKGWIRCSSYFRFRSLRRGVANSSA